MFRTLSTFLAIGSLLLLGISSPAADTQSDVDVRHTGDKVPNFKVRTLDGRKTTLRAIQSDENSNSSGVTVLTFWCSFCGSCRMVDQPLSDLSQKYKGKVAVMALDSSAGEEARTISKVLDEKTLTMPVLIDARGELADLFGAKMTTTTIVIDSNSVIRYWGQFKHGDHALAEQAIEAVLAGKKPAHDHTKERG
ncbi:MAG: peroxiredoxin family protein [Pirellulaceae bacterium]